MNAIASRATATIVPPRLRRGDTIGLVAPAGPVQDRALFAEGVRLLRELGYEVKFSPAIFRSDGYLAGSDQERLAELEELWRDPQTKAILAVRGGYGSLRLLGRFDMELVRRHPKILIGFSDISMLLSAIHQATGLITFHGPMLTTLPRTERPELQSFFAMLGGAELSPIKPEGLEIITPGSASGRLLGGNLACLAHLLATPHEPDWRECLLFFEEVNEPPYRVDRTLTQLHEAGKFRGVRGIILGGFTNCGEREILWQRMLELIGDSVPVWAGFPAGHQPRNHILPIGGLATMDGSTGSLRFTAPLVS